VDLRDLYTFTVDPVMAQDFDDALSFERTAAVPPWCTCTSPTCRTSCARDALDREALRRGNSVYVALGAEPMLPPALSSEACSLRPGRPQGGHGGDGRGDKGHVRDSRFYRSLMRSDARLDYEQVERMFRGEETIDPELAAPLEWGGLWRRPCGRPARARQPADRVHRAGVRVGRARRGDFADPSEELESHWYIENFMVLANEQVASFLEREKVPTVYGCTTYLTVQLDRLLDVLSSLGLPTPIYDPMAATPEEIRR